MRTRALFALAIPALMIAADAPKAEIKIGTGIEKHEITGEAAEFKVAVGTKIYAWTKVTGAEGTVTVSFQKDGKEVSKQELQVPRSPYRTNAFRTFRKGDAGAWTVKVMAADGAEIGTASFKVDIEG